MTSLRIRLFLLVAAATAIVWALPAAWTLLSPRAAVERVLDRTYQAAPTLVPSPGSAAPPRAAAAARLAAPRPLPCP